MNTDTLAITSLVFIAVMALLTLIVLAIVYYPYFTLGVLTGLGCIAVFIMCYQIVKGITDDRSL